MDGIVDYIKRKHKIKKRKNPKMFNIEKEMIMQVFSFLVKREAGGLDIYIIKIHSNNRLLKNK